MQNIQYDSRSAGSGKTTGRRADGTIGVGIYPKIIDLYKRNQRVLIVVPSHHLQDQYRSAEEFTGSIASHITLIRSDGSSTENVSTQIADAMGNRKQLVLITHEAFKLTSISDAVKAAYHVIIDEAFDPYGFKMIRSTASNPLNIHKVFGVTRAVQNAWDYEAKKITIDKDSDIEFEQTKWAVMAKLEDEIETSTLQEESKTWKALVNPNSRLWVNQDNWTRINNGEVGDINIGIELNPNIMKGWKSVYIAAAAFEFTFMFNWMFKNGLIPRQIPGCEFIPSNRVPMFYAPDYSDFIWSKTANKEAPNIYHEFNQFVAAELNGRVPLVVRNNFNDVKTDNEEKLTHNVHGMNNYASHTAVVLGSALNPSNSYRDFLRHQYAFGETDNDEKFELYLVRAWAGYLFYQVLMRSALRNPNSQAIVDVFTLDKRIMLALGEYFNIDDLPIETYLRLYKLNAIDEFLLKRKLSKEAQKEIKAAVIEEKKTLKEKLKQKLKEEKKKMKEEARAIKIAEKEAEKARIKQEKAAARANKPAAMTAAERMRKMREKKKMEQGN